MFRATLNGYRELEHWVIKRGNWSVRFASAATKVWGGTGGRTDWLFLWKHKYMGDSITQHMMIGAFRTLNEFNHRCIWLDEFEKLLCIFNNMPSLRPWRLLRSSMIMRIIQNQYVVSKTGIRLAWPWEFVGTRVPWRTSLYDENIL